MGSASEVEYFLLLAKDLHYLGQPHYEALIADLFEVKRMQVGLLKRLTQAQELNAKG